MNKFEMKYKWFRKMDVSARGKLAGVDPLKTKTAKGDCFKALFAGQQIMFVEWHKDGKLAGLKGINYDGQGRAAFISFIKNDRLIDSWVYEYQKSGFRKAKFLLVPGKQPKLLASYDKHGKKK